MLDARVVKRRRSLLVDVTLTVPAGSTIALFGASGAGKSTVLSCIAGFEEPDDGFINVGDMRLFPPSLPLYARPVGYMTQDADLFPHLTVAQNVEFGAVGSDDREWVVELRNRLQLGSLWKAAASRLSGGQARRVALARMLAKRPSLVLLDEPFAGLDRPIVRELIDDLLSWQARLGYAMVVVDHDVPVLERLCPYALILESGSIVQSGAWGELHKTPATLLLKDLLEPL